MPGIIKAVYFHTLPAAPIFSTDDAIRIAVALNRVGSNVNQVAKHLNSGFRAGFNPALEEIADQLRALKQFALGHHGSR